MVNVAACNTNDPKFVEELGLSMHASGTCTMCIHQHSQVLNAKEALIQLLADKAGLGP